MTMSRWWILVPAVLLGFGSVWAQDPQDPKEDDRFRPGQERDDDELTPEEAMRLMKEAQVLMMTAEELLHDSSRGKALETEAEIMKKLQELLKDEKDPAALQKQILKKIGRLMKKVQQKQEGVLGKLTEIIRKARACSSSNCRSCQKKQQQQEQQEQKRQQQARPQRPGNPATRPYNPNRRTPSSKFRSRADKSGLWGQLPPRLRDAMLHGRRDIDDYPPEFQELLKEYMKRLAGTNPQ